jgi:methylenetetrahydrofolate reductase (NADPH)
VFGRRRAPGLGLLDQVRVLVGVGPLRSAAAAERIRSHIPGVTIPDPIIARLRSVPRSEQQAEGIEICVETIQTVREIPGVSGVHIMAFRHPEDVVAIVDKANLLSRPKNRE